MAHNTYNKKQLDPLKIGLIALGGLFVFFVAMVLIFRPDSWEDYITSQSEEETYFVYIYTDDCIYCQQIATDVANFTQSNTMDIELIPVDAYAPSVPTPSSDFQGTPTLYVVHKGEITDELVGPNSILQLFEEVNMGIFQP